MPIRLRAFCRTRSWARTLAGRSACSAGHSWGGPSWTDDKPRPLRRALRSLRARRVQPGASWSKNLATGSRRWELVSWALQRWAPHYRSVNSARCFASVERYAHERLALFASTKHGRSGPRLEQLVRLGVVPGPRGVPPQRRRPGRDCACLAVNGVGKPGAGESPARFDRGRWRREGHGEPEGCTHRETGGTEPGRLRLADQPAAYLTPISSPLPLLRGNLPTRRAWDLRG